MGGVCPGFHKKACYIVEDMERLGALDAVKKEAAACPFDRIFMVGHSLAGAVVTIFQLFSVADPGGDIRKKHPEYDFLRRIYAVALGSDVPAADAAHERFTTFALQAPGL